MSQRRESPAVDERRRHPPPLGTLTPLYVPSTPTSMTAVPFPASGSTSSTRSSAPTTAISSFFARGAKFFNKGGQSSKSSSGQTPIEPTSASPPRLSSSQLRTRNISGPTSARPFHPSDTGSIYAQPNQLAARSVVNLGSPRRANTEVPSPTLGTLGAEVGDLRRISSKAWAHSADDLGNMLNPQEGLPSSSHYSDTGRNLEAQDERVRKPSLNLRIEAYRNNLLQNQAQQPGSPSFPRDIPSPTTLRSGTHSANSSPLNPRFPPHSSQEKNYFPISTSDSSPNIGSAMVPNNTHSRSNSYNVLGSVGFADSQPQSSRHKISASGNIPNFSFPFGARAHPSVQVSTEKAQKDNRRASQVIHHSGFLNRNVGASFPLNLNKNWKAYKGEIKGSKLYLYKPPSEKANGVRDLFPIEYGLEAVDESDQGGTSGSQGTDKFPKEEPRRKRLFWGPGRHPDIITDSNGAPKSGTTEALVYEVVFASMFGREDADGWRRFSRAILLVLPALIGEAKFETDLTAVIDRYIRFADVDMEAEVRQARMEWLLSVYAEYYHPAGFSPRLEEFITASSLRVVFPQIYRAPPFQLPEVTSATPQGGSDKPRMLTPSNSYTGNMDERYPTRISTSGGILADLQHRGLSRERMLGIDTTQIAQSLHLFLLKESFRARRGVDAQHVIAALDDKTTPWPMFSDRGLFPHWLKHFVVAQILAPVDGSVSVSATHSRFQAITKWIRIAESGRLTGNECLWRAVMEGLVSKPIARLEKTWRRVDVADRQHVEAYVRGEKMLKNKGEGHLPWLTETTKRLRSHFRQLKDQHQFQVILMREVFDVIQEVQTRWETCTLDGFTLCHADVLDLFRFWEAFAPKQLLSAKPIDEYLPASFEAEPFQNGRLAQYFFQPRNQNYHLHALVPFTFTEPLPSLAFLDRSELVRLRKESLDKHGNAASHDLQMEHLTRLRFFPSEHVRSHWTSKEGIDLDDTIFRLFNGEMIVKVVKETQPSSRPASFFENGAASLSRRPSRAPSIRVTPHAASTLERKSSSARRQSMPLLNNKPRAAPADNTSSASPELTVPVVIVGGTIERLVDVLIRGLDYVMAATSDDNGEMALIDRKAKGLRIDQDEFSKIWWNTYRSFLSPVTFVAMLRKNFRTTVSPPQQAITNSDYSRDFTADANFRMAILTVLNEWFMDGRGITDLLDQPELYNEVESWLHDEREHAVPAEVIRNVMLQPVWKELEDTRTNLITIFETQTKRPSLRHAVSYDPGSYGSSTQSYGSKLPDVDKLGALELVEQLDAIGAVAVRGLQSEDLVSFLEILEIQSKDKTGWTLLTDLPTLSQDEMIIQNIYFHLTLVEPSSLLTDLPHNRRLVQLARPSIRMALHCFDQARVWATAVLSQQGIPIETRERRMELFLQALDLCRFLSSKTDKVENGAPVIRSFVESVLTTAILSPESRLFQRAWHHVAVHRRVNSVDSLESFIRPLQEEECSLQPGFKLAVDFGWVVERLLELISMPDILANTSDTMGTVINFEKRRHLYTFILNIPTLATSRPSKQRSHLNTIDMERLYEMHRWAGEVLSGGDNIGVSQSIKEEAYQENMQGMHGAPTRKYYKPFSKTLASQQEKNKRDRQIREKLQREKRMDQYKKEKQSVPYDKAMDVAKKSRQGKRASMNPFMRVVRPLSTAFPFGGGPSLPPEAAEPRKYTLEELNFMPTTKPALSVDLAGVKVEEKQTAVRPFIFTLEAEDGVKYYFQATTKKELAQWISQLSKTSKRTSEKRRTYIGPSSNLPDLYRMPKNLGRHPTAVFSVPLEFLLEREYGGVYPGAIPSFLERCLEEVEARGFEEDGIYRISGSKLQIDRLKAELNTGSHVELLEEDIHTISSLIKLWIREIPDGLMPNDAFWLAVEAVQISDRSQSITLMRQAVNGLPMANSNVLRRVIEHLSVASTHEERTRMAEKQFSLVFGQTILTPPSQGGIKAINAGIQYGNRVVEVMLNYYHAIFEEEADGDGEDDDDEGEDDDDEGHVLEGLEEEDEEQVA